MKKSAKSAPETDSADVETVNEEANGQLRIPGTEVKVIKPIINLVKQNKITKQAHKEATNALEAENAEALRLFEKYKEHFTEQPNGNFLYERAGARLEITRPGEMKPKMKVLDPDEDEE